VNAKDNYGRTPLHLAEYYFLETVMLPENNEARLSGNMNGLNSKAQKLFKTVQILEKIADNNVKDNNNQTPFDFAKTRIASGVPLPPY